MSRQWITVALVLCLAMAANPIVLQAGTDAFTDIPQNHWSLRAVQRLVSKGILSGYPDGTFRGNNLVTRYALAVTLAKAIQKVGVTGKIAVPGRSSVKVSTGDLETLEKLIKEFANELSLLGVKTASFEERLKAMRRDLDTLKGRVDALEEGKAEKNKDGALSFEDGSFRLVYFNKQALGDLSETIMNFSFKVEDQVNGKIGIRYTNMFDQNTFPGNPGDDLDMEEAYVDFSKLNNIDRLRAGRFYRKIGSGLTLWDLVEGYQLTATRKDTFFELADYDSTFFHLASAVAGEGRAGFYLHRQNKVAGVRPSHIGLYAKFEPTKKLKVGFEFADFDSDTPAGNGKAWIVHGKLKSGKDKIRMAVGTASGPYRARAVDIDYAYKGKDASVFENVLQAIQGLSGPGANPQDLHGFDILSLGYDFASNSSKWTFSADFDLLSNSEANTADDEFDVITLAAERPVNDRASFQLRYQIVRFDNENAAAQVTGFPGLMRVDNAILRGQFYVRF